MFYQYFYIDFLGVGNRSSIATSRFVGMDDDEDEDEDD